MFWRMVAASVCNLPAKPYSPFQSFVSPDSVLTFFSGLGEVAFVYHFLEDEKMPLLYAYCTPGFYRKIVSSRSFLSGALLSLAY